MIDVQLCGNPCGAQLLEIADSLGVERFAVADERIGGRQPGKVGQPRGRGIGRKGCAIRAAQIEPPREMVAARVPDAAVVVTRGGGVAVVQHGIERHLKGDVYRSFIPCADADGGAQPAARALTADHELIAPNTERGGVLLQIVECGKAIVERGRVGSQRRQPVSRREHDRAEVPHQIGCAGGIYHLLHPDGIAAAVQPQNARGVGRCINRREQQCRDAAMRRGDAQLLDADGLVRAHRAESSCQFRAVSKTGPVFEDRAGLILGGYLVR